MDTYINQRPRLDHDGETYGPGDEVELTDEEAAPLLALGAIEETGDSGTGPSEDLVELVGTRQANALADAGLTTIEEAIAANEAEDITEYDGVGQGTADDLADFAE